MKVSDTISVNPGKKALGHVDTPSVSIFRHRVLGVENETEKVDYLKILFPTLSSGNSQYKKYEVSLRTILATILIVAGITMLESTFWSPGYGVAVCSLCFGAFLALGLLTRPIMIAASIYYCLTGALTIRSGNPDITLFFMMFGCLIFSVIGGGKYSCDTLIRHSIVRYKRNKEAKRRADCMGYKAFHSVKF